MSIEQTFYSASDVCKIIKECSKSGVSSISLLKIEILFGEKPAADQPEPTIHHLSVEDQPLKTEVPEKEEEIRSIVAEQARDMVHLSDPQAWEKMELMEMDQDEARR